MDFPCRDGQQENAVRRRTGQQQQREAERALHDALDRNLVERASASSSEQRIDKRRDNGALSEYDQRPEQEQPCDNRRKPELLALAHETPQIFDELNHQYGLFM
jgi:hypothetical protein